ncbi:MAG: hypothetical protein LBK61_07475 [Spirochaetaceae bacterium]|jgi:hypothetical protein|nr:hypothetical protein [Spirochaetaceae bacterium]
MAENAWYSALREALAQRHEWLSNEEIPKLRNSFRQFYLAYATLYTILVSKSTIAADPYKNESKVSELVMPEIGLLNENNRHDQFSLRLANFDNQLDFIVNFYALSVDELTQDKIKILLAVVKFIDWLHTTPDSSSQNTQAMANIITTVRQHPYDPLSAKNFTESLKKLEVETKELTSLLKEFSDYNREVYKFAVREQITAHLSADEITTANIKKKFPGVFKGKPFYTELIEDIVKEDTSQDAPVLQKKVLKSLAVEGAVQEDAKEKQPVSIKLYLIEGINAMGSAGTTLGDVLAKIEINHRLFQNKRKSLGEKIKELFAAIISKESDPVVYNCESIDPNRNGGLIKEKILYSQFRDDLEKKSKVLRAVAANGAAAAKLETMEEDQLVDLLDRNIREIQIYLRQLTFFDGFFKSEVDASDKDKVKGIKPELSTLKNAVTKAAAKKQDYMAAQEEAAQFKKLGIEM